MFVFIIKRKFYFVILEPENLTAQPLALKTWMLGLKKKKMDLVKFVQDEFVPKNEFPEFGAGDTLTVYYKIKEGEKERTQFFKGVVIQRRGAGITETFTIRKIGANGIGVERIFPVNSPILEKIEVNKKGMVRRARIFYLRDLTGKKARIKERRM